MDTNAQARPLADIETAREVRLVSIDAGRGLMSRLASMGFLPGTAFTVKANRGFGPVIVALKGTRDMIGRGMAQKMLVE